MKIVDCKQGSGEWLSARAGVFTASELDNLITPEWKKRTGQTPETYILRKLTEKLVGPLRDASSWAMEQGSILEKEAIPWLEFTHGLKVDRIGFITSDDGLCGCSPDGIIGDDGGVEAKCPQPETHLKYLLNGGVPKEYLAQVHGSMFVTGRPWWIFLSYSRQFPPYLVRVERDEKIIAAIKSAVDDAIAEFQSKLAKIKAIKEADEAPKRAEYEAKIKRWQETGEIP